MFKFKKASIFSASAINFKNKNRTPQQKIIIPAFLSLIALAVCLLPKSAQANVVILSGDATTSATLRPTRTATAAFTPLPTETSSPVPSMTPTAVSTASIQITYQPAGTALPNFAGPLQIDADGSLNLVQVAQWGLGTVLQAQFTQGGSHIVAASQYGWMDYDLTQNQPVWNAFPEPIHFETMNIDPSEKYICFSAQQDYIFAETIHVCLDTRTRKIVEGIDSSLWNQGTTIFRDYQKTVRVLSPDGRHAFSWEYADDQGGSVEKPRIVELEFAFPVSRQPSAFRETGDDLYVQYLDRVAPEGCEIDFFGYCGNSFESLILVPYKTKYLPDSTEIGVLFRMEILPTAVDYGILKLYDTNFGNTLLSLGTFDDPIVDFDFSPDGKHLLSVFYSGAIQVYDLESHAQLFHAWDFNAPYSKLVSVDEGSMLLVRDLAGYIKLLRATDGALINRYPTSIYALSPVEPLLALGYENGTIQIIDLSSGKTTQSFQAHNARIYGLTFSADGRTLVSSSKDCTVKSWNVQTGAYLHIFSSIWVKPYDEVDTPSRIFARNLTAVAGTNQLLSYGSWGTIVSWNIETGSTQYVVYSQPEEEFTDQFTFDPHFPTTIWAVPQENSFYIDFLRRDITDGSITGVYTAKVEDIIGCSSATATTPDGNFSFAAGYDRFQGEICVIDNRSHALAARFIPPVDIENLQLYSPVKFILSPDGETLFVLNRGGAVFVYRNLN